MDAHLADYIGRCMDAAVNIVIGLAIMFIAPRQIRRRIESGKLTEAKGKSLLKLVWPVGCIAIGYGIFKIIAD